MQLRPYQAEAIDKLRSAYKTGKKSLLLVAPTGAGKTVMFSSIVANRIGRGLTTMILVHRQELVDQVVRTLAAFGVTAGVIAAGSPATDSLVQVASVWTLSRRLHRHAPPQLLIIDEAHHAVAQSWQKVITAYSNAIVLGVTATPERQSGEGLDALFQDMILGPTVAQLQDIGALCHARTFAPPGPDLSGVATRMGDWVPSELELAVEKSSVMGDAIAHYKSHCDGEPAIAFCVSVKHAQHVAEQFRQAGYTAVSIDGSMEKEERKGIVKEFTDGRINILTSCDLVSEGFDVPRATAAILLRPTQSRALFLQQCGRCLRPWPGKERAVILDHAGNTGRFGLVSDEQQWTLSGRKRRAGSKKPAVPEGVRICTSCFSASRATGSACFHCGTAFPIKQRATRVVEGSLVEVTASPVRKRRQLNPATDYAGLVALGKQRGYRAPEIWARHIINARLKKGR